jgi:hypothetical protein
VIKHIGKSANRLNLRVPGWSFKEECIRKCGYRITPKERK